MGFAEKPAVGVAVVSYRSPGRTCAFVSRELPKLPFAYETCVVDVASTPETRRGLEEGLPSGVHRLFFEENLGYSRGNNAAARLLREKLPGMKYLLVCNDDILFDGDSHLERLLDFLESHPECGIAGPSVRGVDGAEQSPWNCADDLGAARTGSGAWRPPSAAMRGSATRSAAVFSWCVRNPSSGWAALTRSSSSSSRSRFLGRDFGVRVRRRGIFPAHRRLIWAARPSGRPFPAGGSTVFTAGVFSLWRGNTGAGRGFRAPPGHSGIFFPGLRALFSGASTRGAWANPYPP